MSLGSGIHNIMGIPCGREFLYDEVVNQSTIHPHAIHTLSPIPNGSHPQIHSPYYHYYFVTQ